MQVREALEREADATREFLAHAPVPAPEPLAIGEPEESFPLPWTVHTWLPGAIATPDSVSSSHAFARDLARLIWALRTVDVRGRTFRSGRGGRRGGQLSTHDAWMEICFQRSTGLVDVAPLRRLWAELRQLPQPGTLAMTHGDLTPMNLLVEGDRLAGVLDTGDFGPADPALDLVCAWHLFEAGPRGTLRDALSCPGDEWQRGMAWAFEQAMGLGWYYQRTNSLMAKLGYSTLARIVAAA